MRELTPIGRDQVAGNLAQADRVVSHGGASVLLSGFRDVWERARKPLTVAFVAGIAAVPAAVLGSIAHDVQQMSQFRFDAGTLAVSSLKECTFVTLTPELKEQIGARTGDPAPDTTVACRIMTTRGPITAFFDPASLDIDALKKAGAVDGRAWAATAVRDTGKTFATDPGFAFSRAVHGAAEAVMAKIDGWRGVQQAAESKDEAARPFKT